MQTFFNAMFLTPPYPSSLDVMMFGPVIDEDAGGTVCSTTSTSTATGEDVSFYSTVASMADSYPNIKLVYDIAFDQSSSVYGLSCAEAVAEAFAQYPSVYGIGVEGEYLGGSGNPLPAFCNYVNSLGKQCISYYISQLNLTEPSNGYEIRITPFPMQGGQVDDLQLSSPSYVGLTTGYYANFPFPTPDVPPPNGLSCPIQEGDVAPADSNPVDYPNQGYNQCVVSTILSAAVNFQPASERQFVELCVGFSGSAAHGQPDQPFTGVSGLTTYQLWDNPTLRNWIWTDPDYAPNFVLSTDAAPPTSTTTTASTTSSSTSSATSTSTASTTTTSSTASISPPYPYIYRQSSLGFVLGTNVSVTSLNVNQTTQVVTFTAPPVSFEFFSPTAYTVLRILDDGTDVTADAIVQTNSTGTLYLENGSSSWEIDYSQSGTTTTSTSSSTTSTTLANSSSTVTSSSSTSTSQTSSASSIQTSWETTYLTTTTLASSQGYALSVVGGCPSTGSGVYAAGSVAVVQIMGVCDRNGNSGLRVTSWSLDGGANTTVLTNGTYALSELMNAPHTITFYTVNQYHLSLDYGAQNTLLSLTPPTIPGDNYWYDSGTVVTFVGAAQLPGYTVEGWELDSGAPSLILGAPDLTASFVMNGPHTLVILLAPATNSCPTNSCTTASTFLVTVQANVSTSGGVWVDGEYYTKPVTFVWQAASTHNVTAALGSRQASVRTLFVGWSGLSDSQSRALTITVNASGNLTADYSRQYLVTLAFTDAVGEPLTPQAVTLKGPTGTQELGTNLSVWVEPGASYSIASATWMDWNAVMSNYSSFKVTQPTTLTLPLSVYPQTIKATDVYNLPLSGATVNVTALNGFRISVTTDAQGLASFRVPVGLFNATVSYLGVSNRVVAQSEGSHSYTVSFLLSYPLLATIAAASALVGIFALFRLRKLKASGIYVFSDP